MNWPRTLLRTLGRRLPRLDGTLTVPGLAAEVIIRRDRFGVPHIEASGDADAWFGLGFCQGQDRSFQLETRLRVVRGTLAELIGEEGLKIDELSRRIGFRRHGQRCLDHLSAAQVVLFQIGVVPLNQATRRGVVLGRRHRERATVAEIQAPFPP